MSEFSKSFLQLEQQVVKLIARKDQLESERNELKKINEELENKMTTQGNEIEKLIEKNKILRIAGGSKEGDQREIKLKINEIVREVDKCIAQLNH